MPAGGDLLVYRRFHSGGETGAYRAVEFIKANIKLEGVTKASVSDSKNVVEICTQYAQKGMFNIFLTVFFATLAFAFVEPYFFIGYLISIALFGLYQAIFMANAGGAWDNAKKIVETELKAKGTRCMPRLLSAIRSAIRSRTLLGGAESDHQIHDAVWIVGRGSRGFGANDQGTGLTTAIAVVFLAISMFFVYRSFYGMRIQ